MFIVCTSVTEEKNLLSLQSETQRYNKTKKLLSWKSMKWDNSVKIIQVNMSG